MDRQGPRRPAHCARGRFRPLRIQPESFPLRRRLPNRRDAGDYAGGPNEYNGYDPSGQNDSGYTVVFSGSGTEEELLEELSPASEFFDITQFDITFDMEAGYDTLHFDLVFGSEEFPEWVGSYIDAFGLYVNNVSIASVNGSDVNIDHPEMRPHPNTNPINPGTGLPYPYPGFNAGTT